MAFGESMRGFVGKSLFVTGIGTDVGKTMVSAILVEGLRAHYWKPIQSGTLESSDSDRIQSLVSHPDLRCYQEAYRLNAPISPHAAAALENQWIDIESIQLPKWQGPLIIEGAGGVLTPLTEDLFMIDLMASLGIPVILVSRHYLGSINHTLLSLAVLRERHIPLAGIVFNGSPQSSSETVILRHAQVPCLGRLLPEAQITSQVISSYAQQWFF